MLRYISSAISYVTFVFRKVVCLFISLVLLVPYQCLHVSKQRKVYVLKVHEKSFFWPLILSVLYKYNANIIAVCTSSEATNNW